MPQYRKRPWWLVRMNSNFPARWLVLWHARVSSQPQRWQANYRRLSKAAWRALSGRIKSSAIPNFLKLPRESYSASGFASAGETRTSIEPHKRSQPKALGLAEEILVASPTLQAGVAPRERAAKG